jgi:hypothetical protein
MAALPGDRLTAAYRAAQVRNAALLAAKLRRRYAAVDLSVTESQRAFLELATGDVVFHHARATDQSVIYLRSLQSLEAAGPLVPVDAGPPPNLEQIRRSLAVMGPVAGRQRVAEVQSDPESARGIAERNIAQRKTAAGVMGAGIRHAQNGARDTVRQYVEKDRRARGWVRVTAQDDRVCAFCAMLASRIDWKEGNFDASDAEFVGPGTAKVHDSCRCHLRPIYSRELPEETLFYREQWSALSAEAIDGSNRGLARNFRSQWEKRQRGLDAGQPSRVA